MSDVVMEEHGVAESFEGVQQRVLELFSSHTGYGKSDIVLDNHFDSDYGIDSITLTTLLSDIIKEYRIPTSKVPDSINTLNDIFDFISSKLNIEKIDSQTVNSKHEDDNAGNSLLVEKIQSVFAKHTGYSIDQLDVNVDFESDLGIDSVTLVSILADIPSVLAIDGLKLPENLRTIEALIHYLDTNIDSEKKSVLEEYNQEDGVEVETINKPKVEKSIDSDHEDDDSSWKHFLSQLLSTDDDSTLTENKVKFSFSSLGFNQHHVNELYNKLTHEFHMPNQIRLSDCDTPEKILHYIQASKEFELAPIKEIINQVSHVNEDEEIRDNDPRTMKDFVAIEHKDLFHKTREFRKFYKKKQRQQLYWYGMPLESRCQNRALIYDETTGKRREFLMFASNNYLGLANHPSVIDAICEGARQYGATNTGCRLIGGSNILHKELETKLAKLKGRESCIVYPSGYSANLGGISALAGPKDLVFTDAINHMSIQDGCKLSGAGRKIYQHSLDNLEQMLDKYAEHEGGKLIVTDGVFSMHGDIVDLPRLMQIARKYNARVLVDDAHSTGVLGKTGSGTTEHFGMKGEVDLELGTMSKALAGVGGFICGDEDVIEYLRFYSNSYVFAATIPAAVAAGLIASIDVMEKEPQRLSKLWSNIHYLRSHLLSAGFDLENSASAILPIVIGDDQKTLEFGRAVRAKGMYCQSVVYPGIAVGDARLRISVTSEHTIEDLDLAAQILVDSAKEVNIPVANSH
ncbi:aminotransferase class I/II-fold pyridoxal phosphate-dependent enzyme [Zooshikella sp. RANM57]|uniref:aminotransferase class I/II-fold pyridoxal phosphate-dependent enzyme n=1 Tax=Zooshikella sp. RANM57 TaxID=3425863 RepID=UPI003D6E9107